MASGARSRNGSGPVGLQTRARIQQQTALALKDNADPRLTDSDEHGVQGHLGIQHQGLEMGPLLSLERFIDRVPEGWLPDGAWRLRLPGRKVAKRKKVSVFIQRDWLHRYNPAQPGVALAEIGAGIDDLRLHRGMDGGIMFRHTSSRSGQGLTPPASAQRLGHLARPGGRTRRERRGGTGSRLGELSLALGHHPSQASWATHSTVMPVSRVRTNLLPRCFASHKSASSTLLVGSQSCGRSRHCCRNSPRPRCRSRRCS